MSYIIWIALRSKKITRTVSVSVKNKTTEIINIKNILIYANISRFTLVKYNTTEINSRNGKKLPRRKVL